MQSTDEAQQTLEQNFAPWIQDMKPQVTEIGPECAVIEIPITDHLSRMGGMISGQALAALADTTMVFACAGHFGEFKPVATTNLDTQFLRPGKGEAIRCEARVVRAGRQIVFARAELSALPEGKLVATATGTFFAP